MFFCIFILHSNIQKFSLFLSFLVYFVFSLWQFFCRFATLFPGLLFPCSLVRYLFLPYILFLLFFFYFCFVLFFLSIAFNFSFRILFLLNSFCCSIFIIFRSLTYSCSTLYCFLIVNWKLKDLFWQAPLPCVLLLLFFSVHTKNSIEKFMTRNFLSSVSNFMSLLLLSTSFRENSGRPLRFYFEVIRKILCLSIIALCLKVYVYPSRSYGHCNCFFFFLIQFFVKINCYVY